MDLRFSEFMKDLRKENGVALRESAWLTHALLATKQGKSFQFFEN